jgi:hypothetical protein
MFSSLERNALDNIDVVEMLINVHKETEGKCAPGIRNNVKVYTVSSCVTRLYAVYENFIKAAMSDYLDILSELVKFSALTNEFKNNYRLGISHLLAKVDQGRYKHLSHENIVKWYYEALNDKSKYRFVTDALTRHEQNMRLNIVLDIYSRIDLKELGGWLSKHPEIKALYEDKDSIYQQLEAEVTDFVKTRNEASHGGMDSLISEQNLYRYCNIVRAFIKALTCYLSKDLLIRRMELGTAIRLGITTEVFPKSSAFIAKLCDGAEIAAGAVFIL